MTDFEALQIMVQVHALRLNPQYQAAIAILMGESKSAEDMALNKKSRDYAAIRFIIGTWENIATYVQDFSPQQKDQLFRCNPIGVMWRLLDPAVKKIREKGASHENDTATPNFASKFKDLGEVYITWASSVQEFNSMEKQAIRAMFG